MKPRSHDKTVLSPRAGGLSFRVRELLGRTSDRKQAWIGLSLLPALDPSWDTGIGKHGFGRVVLFHLQHMLTAGLARVSVTGPFSLDTMPSTFVQSCDSTQEAVCGSFK